MSGKSLAEMDGMCRSGLDVLVRLVSITSYVERSVRASIAQQFAEREGFTAKFAQENIQTAEVVKAHYESVHGDDPYTKIALRAAELSITGWNALIEIIKPAAKGSYSEQSLEQLNSVAYEYARRFL